MNLIPESRRSDRMDARIVKASERSLPASQRRGIIRAVFTDQDASLLTGPLLIDQSGCGVKGGQGRTARELVRPFFVFARCIRAARRFLTLSR